MSKFRVQGRGFSRASVLTLMMLLILTGVLWFRGYTFYRLPLYARGEHPEFRKLSPAGLYGQGYGVAGFALICTNLLYLIRRKLARLPLGSLKAWLDMHVFTGLAGSVLVIFHSAFQLRNAIAAIASVGLAVVVLTGVVGRYLYAIAPTIDSRRVAALMHELNAWIPGLGNEIRIALAHRAVSSIGYPTLGRAIVMLPQWMREGRERKKAVYNAWDKYAPKVDKHMRKDVKPLVNIAAKIATAQVRSVMGTTFLQVWRPLHRFFAIMMLLAVAIHVGVAWYYGYRWIWG